MKNERENDLRDMITVVGRDRRPNTVHHLVSRIAHRVYFMNDEEKNDFVDLMLRVADFTGIRLIGWCIMTNHFHVLAYLPECPAELSDEEVVRRWRRIAPVQGRYGVECDFEHWAASGDFGWQLVEQAIKRLRGRMYSISWFMKMVKQWFTEGYNAANKHKGTLWESVYRDRVIDDLGEEARDCLCYIHLNPIRAAITADFDAYPWSSLCCVRNGDALAIAGLRMIYGEAMPLDEILAAHHRRMGELLEDIKLKRAKELVHKRSAGVDLKPDALTEEALVAQVAAQVQDMERQIADAHARVRLAKSAKERFHQLELEIELLHRSRPGIRPQEVAATVEKPCSTVYRIIKRLRSLGRIAA